MFVSKTVTLTSHLEGLRAVRLVSALPLPSSRNEDGSTLSQLYPVIIQIFLKKGLTCARHRAKPGGRVGYQITNGTPSTHTWAMRAERGHALPRNLARPSPSGPHQAWFPESPAGGSGAPGAAPERPPRGRGVQAPGQRGPLAFPSSGDPGHPNAAPRAPTGSHVRPRRAACGRRLPRRTSAALVGWEGGPTEGPARPGQERRARRPGPALRSCDPNVPAPGRSTRPLRSPRGIRAPQAAGGGQKQGDRPLAGPPCCGQLGSQAEAGLNASSSAGRLGGAARLRGILLCTHPGFAFLDVGFHLAVFPS